MYLTRVFATLFLITSVFFLPWAVSFAVGALFVAIFSWYFEIFIFGLTASVLIGAPSWKFAFILAFLILVEEFFREHLNLRQTFALFPLVVLGVLSIMISAFIVL